MAYVVVVSWYVPVSTSVTRVRSGFPFIVPVATYGSSTPDAVSLPWWNHVSLISPSPFGPGGPVTVTWRKPRKSCSGRYTYPPSYAMLLVEEPPLPSVTIVPVTTSMPIGSAVFWKVAAGE